MGLQRIEARAYDDIRNAIEQDGGVVVRRFLRADQVERVNEALDGFVAASSRGSSTGSKAYDQFLGAQTVVLHGLLAKTRHVEPVINHPLAVAFAEHLLGDRCASIILSTSEFREVGPGAAAQSAHQDDSVWSYVRPRMAGPLSASTLVALTPFTAEAGATRLWIGSHQWPEGKEKRSRAEAHVHAEMDPGDAVFFRGDVLHAAGANTTPATRRRGIVTNYCLGWLRAVENSILNTPLAVVRELQPRTQELIGYGLHDEAPRGGVTGLYENGHPARLLA